MMMTQYEKARALAHLLGERSDTEFAPGGIPISAIAEQVGTPFFAYASDALLARLRRVKHTLGQTDQELREAVEWGLESINVESEGELLRVSRAAARAGKTARVSLRINPVSHVKGAQMRMGGGHTQFGIDEERLEGLLARIGRHPRIALVAFMSTSARR